MICAAIHGFLLAFGLILPLGVQNVFVFNQGGLQKSWIRVLPVVLTASICDTLLISLAVLGVSAVVLEVTWIRSVLLLAGVLFLLYMGYATWRSRPNQNEASYVLFSARRQIAFAASVSLLNPHAIMDTIGVIGTSSLSYTGTVKIIFMISCILVSWIWFFSLALAGKLLGRLDPSGKSILMLNKVSAIIMCGTAIFLIFSLK